MRYDFFLYDQRMLYRGPVASASSSTLDTFPLQSALRTMLQSGYPLTLDAVTWIDTICAIQNGAHSIDLPDGHVLDIDYVNYP